MGEGFICRRGGGVSLPSTIAAGETTLYSVAAHVVQNTVQGWAYPGSGYGFTALKAGTYRIYYNVESDAHDTACAARLIKNGVEVAGSFISTTYSASKTIDVALLPGDVILYQCAKWNGPGAVPAADYFVIRILAPELQAEFSKIITPAS